MSEYIITVDEDNERWHYVEQQYTHFFGYPITEEIVRCRDCKRFYTNTNGFDCPKLEPDGFCAWASRREGAES